MNLSLRRVSLHIHGKVQGVFFRRESQREALRLNLAGFVRNDPDGSVYAEAEGDSVKVGDFIRWCRSGPSNAVVDSVESQEMKSVGDKGFEVRF